MVLLGRTQQTKADCIFALFAAWKSSVGQQRGLVHQAMRGMLNPIHPARRDNVTWVLRLVTLVKTMQSVANYKGFLMLKRDYQALVPD